VASYKVFAHIEPGGDGPSNSVRKEQITIQWGQVLEGWLFLLGVLTVVFVLAALLYLIEKYDWSE